MTHHKTLSPRWYGKSLKHRMQMESFLEDWLFDPASLTAKLRQKCPELSVNILSERLEQPLADESLRLNLSPGTRVWARTVTLNCNNQPLIYARTIIPDFHAGNAWYSLKALGHTPLGHILFQGNSKSRFLRSDFECQNQRQFWPFLDNFCKREKEIGKDSLSRRCEFIKKGNSLLLTEVFLPESFPFLR